MFTVGRVIKIIWAILMKLGTIVGTIYYKISSLHALSMWVFRRFVERVFSVIKYYLPDFITTHPFFEMLVTVLDWFVGLLAFLYSMWIFFLIFDFLMCIFYFDLFTKGRGSVWDRQLIYRRWLQWVRERGIEACVQFYESQFLTDLYRWRWFLVVIACWGFKSYCSSRYGMAWVNIQLEVYDLRGVSGYSGEAEELLLGGFQRPNVPLSYEPEPSLTDRFGQVTLTITHYAAIPRAFSVFIYENISLPYGPEEFVPNYPVEFLVDSPYFYFVVFVTLMILVFLLWCVWRVVRWRLRQFYLRYRGRLPVALSRRQRRQLRKLRWYNRWTKISLGLFVLLSLYGWGKWLFGWPIEVLIRWGTGWWDPFDNKNCWHSPFRLDFISRLDILLDLRVNPTFDPIGACQTWFDSWCPIFWMSGGCPTWVGIILLMLALVPLWTVFEDWFALLFFRAIELQHFHWSWPQRYRFYLQSLGKFLGSCCLGAFVVCLVAEYFSPSGLFFAWNVGADIREPVYPFRWLVAQIADVYQLLALYVPGWVVGLVDVAWQLFIGWRLYARYVASPWALGNSLNSALRTCFAWAQSRVQFLKWGPVLRAVVVSLLLIFGFKWWG